MKLGKKAQYALLFTLHLARVGRSNVASASQSLGISEAFLEQIARQLRIARVIVVKRGPGGGAALNGQPSLMQVLTAVGVEGFISETETKALMAGGVEHRILSDIIGSMASGLTKVLRCPVTDVGAATVLAELKQMETVRETALPN